MKLLHTADWHLGQMFFEYDRRAEHRCFLSWLRAKLVLHEVDLLLIAGDVFDSSNPSAESQKMYYRFLCDVTTDNPELQIIIIAGNHDSAARLEAPNPLFENLNISVRGLVRRTNQGDIDFDHLIVPLRKGGSCLAIPYLRQGDYPDSESYTQGVQKMYEMLAEHAKGKQYPLIAMGHLQATGAEIAESDHSERTIIGGLESVSPDSFSQEIAYTALGHLHRSQRVSGRENVRYAGAPLPMSFAERNNKQGVVLVSLTDNVAEIERLEFDTPVKLLSLPKDPQPLSVVLEEIANLPDGKVDETSPYLEVKVLVGEPEPSMRHQIEKALESKSIRLAPIVAVSPKREHRTFSYEELQSINPMAMATDIFKRKYGAQEMPEKMKVLLQGVIEEIER